MGRLVLSQNAKQFTIVNYESAANLASGKSAVNPGVVRAYSYTLYDKIGRIIEVGEILTDKTVVTAKSESQVLYATHEAFAGAGFKHQVSKTTYDRNDTPPASAAADWQPTYLRNRVAYTTYQQEQNRPVQETHYSYDVHGNVNRLLQLIRHDGNVLAKTVDYEYDLISGKVNKVYYQKAQADQLIHVYAYDGDNRITQVKTSTDNVLFTKEASYEYYAHGPLAKTKLGELNVETETYAYTVQGWIKQMQAEAFSYALGYNEKDYTSIGTSTILATPIAVVNAKSKGLYNGNIASMTSKTPKMTEIPNQQAILQQQYSYDQLNRITGSNTPGAGNAYKTGYSYDANGNIKTLARYDAASTKFDTLVYNYETKTSGYLRTTNRLRWVDDDGLLSGLQQTDVDDQNTDNYNYDAIGNLIRDNQEEIDTIQWTVSGKVRRVIRTAASSKPNLEFEYDASGQRTVKKVIKKNGEITSTYYLRDASGNVMSVYSYNANSDNDPALTEQYLYGSARLGVYTPAANVLSKTRSFGRKSYELSDHLGNVRATLSDYRRLASQAQVQSATDYYPFGMVARSYNSSVIARYSYNGMEMENDIASGDLDFGARIYDSRIARFLSVDPLSKMYTHWSPYLFAADCPIRYIDIFGMGPGDRIKAAEKYKGTAYKQQEEGEKKLRTGSSTDALEYMDCSELVCRVLSADDITDGVKSMNTDALITYLGDATKFEKDQIPQAGDIVLWSGHTGIVKSYNAKTGKVTVVHATHYTNLDGVQIESVVEEEYKLQKYYIDKKGAYFYRPIKENPDEQTTPSASTQNKKNVTPEAGATENNSNGKSWWDDIVEKYFPVAPAPNVQDNTDLNNKSPLQSPNTPLPKG